MTAASPEAAAIYVYGYGNPGRMDDGLGPALIKMLEEGGIDQVQTDCNYQLNIEDAENISGSSIVVFVDASLTAEEPFTFTKIYPAQEITFTTHSISPESVLSLCHDIYNRAPEAYVLAIRGYSWEFKEVLTPEAESNLEKAYSFLLKFINTTLQGNSSSDSA
jgi:hydrogenase maturation protease